MGRRHVCNGKITLQKEGQKRCLKNVSFDLGKRSFSVSQTLMTEFKEFKLSEQEKGRLSRPLREQMCHYIHLNEDEIENTKRELIKTLKGLKDESIIVSASEMGAFICLAAIFSGELPHNVNWRFELKEFAPQLFPQKLVKKKSAAQSYDISLAFSKDGWFRPFPSLCKVPRYMKLKTNREYEEFAA